MASNIIKCVLCFLYLNTMKYQASDNQNEVLPNLLGYTQFEDIALSEFEGFLKAEIILTEALSSETVFDVKYILAIHQLALAHLYSFAGKFRDVNISKAGFPFAAAKFLPQTMNAFDDNSLQNLPKVYSSKEALIVDVAKVHGELLFIHPFREGNGRTARVLANLMLRKHGYSGLLFDRVGKEEFELYVRAVQKSAESDYSLMIEFISAIFPN